MNAFGEHGGAGSDPQDRLVDEWAGPPVPSAERLRAMFSKVAEALSGEPALANQALRARFAPVVLTADE